MQAQCLRLCAIPPSYDEVASRAAAAASTSRCSLRSSRASSIAAVPSQRENEINRFVKQQGDSTYLPFMPSAAESLPPAPPAFVAAHIAGVVQPGEQPKQAAAAAPRITNNTISRIPISSLEVEQERRHAAHQQRPQSARPTSARGNRLNNSSIVLAGPDNCEILSDNPIPGMPHYRHGQQRSGSAQPIRHGQPQQPQPQHVSPSSIAIATAAREASGTVLSEANTSAARPATAHSRIGHGPTASSSMGNLRDLLSRETLQLRHSQRFAAAPRHMPGDHLHGSGAALWTGRTSRTECFAKSDTSFSTINGGGPNSSRCASTTGSALESAAANLLPPPPPPPVRSAAADCELTGTQHMHRHRPASARLATAESQPTDDVDEELNPLHSHKKKVTATQHCDAMKPSTNILVPWSGDGVQRKYRAACDSPLVGKARPARAALAVKDENAQPDRVISTAQQFYAKTARMEAQRVGEGTSLVEFGDEVKSRDDMKRRMLSSAGFW